MSENLLAVAGLTLERLRSFLAIVDAGSIAKVAKGDAARMALLSRQLKELETFFGAPLRRREGKTMVLTDAGKRLARIAAEQFAALEDFKRECTNRPIDVKIGAGNSVVEWLVMPRIGKMRAAMPAALFQLLSLRTADIVSRIQSGAIDLGIIRADAISAGLRGLRLPQCNVGYALFVPPELANGLKPLNLKARLATLPVATSVGGQFRERLETEAASAGWEIQLAVSCSSFTQAARAVASGSCAAILPEIAAVDFDLRRVQRFELPFLRSYTRSIAVVYSRRNAAIREFLGPAAKAIAGLLSEPAN